MSIQCLVHPSHRRLARQLRSHEPKEKACDALPKSHYRAKDRHYDNDSYSHPNHDPNRLIISLDWLLRGDPIDTCEAKVYVAGLFLDLKAVGAHFTEPSIDLLPAFEFHFDHGSFGELHNLVLNCRGSLSPALKRRHHQCSQRDY